MLQIRVVVSCINLWKNVSSCARESHKKATVVFFFIHNIKGRPAGCSHVWGEGRWPSSRADSKSGQAKAPSTAERKLVRMRANSELSQIPCCARKPPARSHLHFRPGPL